jgi:SpoVK/Ycf46/Vps4 family AAA+-type ATPase
LRQLNLDFDPPETPDNIAVETQWPGVAGMYEFKAKLERDVILSLRFPEEARRYGVPLPNGILLYGPPGCGKTFIARKIAEKLAFNFLEVKPGDLASIYVHGTQEKIKAVFEDAAAKAPTVLFFDELDAFTPNRQEAGHHYSAEVNEFLVRLRPRRLQNSEPHLGRLKTNYKFLQVRFPAYNFLHMSNIVSEASNAFEICVEVTPRPKHLAKYSGLSNQVG